MAASWSTQQLAEFLAHVSSFGDRAAAMRGAAERIAEAIEAEVVAVVSDGGVEACVGFPGGSVPGQRLMAVAAGTASTIELPRLGEQAASVVGLHPDLAASIVVVRTGESALDADETHLVRAMGRVLGLTLRILFHVEAERGLRLESERQAREIADRQALIVAIAAIERMISSRAPLERILDAVAGHVARLTQADAIAVRLIDPDSGGSVLVAAHGIGPEVRSAIERLPLSIGVAGLAMQTDRATRIDDYPAAPEAIPALVRDGIKSAIAAPVREDGRVVGMLIASTRRAGFHFRPDDETMLATFAEHVSLAITDARRIQAVYDAALRDSLTGLPNRTLFTTRLTDRLERRRPRRAGRAAVLFLDLDHFKHVNDSLGHGTGDELLIAVADRVRGCLRPDDVVARLGGDEFIVLLDSVENEAAAAVVAERVMAALEAPFRLADREIHVTASIGVHVPDPGSEDADTAMRNADLAMYQAKTSGRSRAETFRPDMTERAARRLELESDLRTAISRGGLTVAYQPIVGLVDGRITGVEALTRWHHPVRGPISPLEFIPLAEETGLIYALGRWVLHEACRQAAAWQARHPSASLQLNVNLSAHEFGRPDLVEAVAAILRQTGFDPHRLVLEITEGVLVRDERTTVERLRALRATGVQVAIDDFGTGYSSLGYLTRLPVDVLKIDRSFVAPVADGPREAAVARSVIELARTLGLQTVAEGVETAAQLDVLRSLGCDTGQGFAIGRPMRPASLGALITRRTRAAA